MILQLKITLLGTEEPVVWRRVLIDDESNFYELHVVIQAVFDWTDSHLWEFSPQMRSNLRIGTIPDPEDVLEGFAEFEEGLEDAEEVLVTTHLNKKGDKFRYLYDFGDSWDHLITLEKISEGELEIPVCLEGQGATPPEDCGGIPGYYHLQKILQDPSHQEYEYMWEWMGMEEGETWDPYEFSVEEANEGIAFYFEEEDEDE